MTRPLPRGRARQIALLVEAGAAQAKVGSRHAFIGEQISMDAAEIPLGNPDFAPGP